MIQNNAVMDVLTIPVLGGHGMPPDPEINTCVAHHSKINQCLIQVVEVCTSP